MDPGTAGPAMGIGAEERAGALITTMIQGRSPNLWRIGRHTRNAQRWTTERLLIIWPHDERAAGGTLHRNDLHLEDTQI